MANPAVLCDSELIAQLTFNRKSCEFQQDFVAGIDHTFELQENYVQDGLPAFQFRKRNGEINWRKLSALDVERVARELDFVTLQVILHFHCFKFAIVK